MANLTTASTQTVTVQGNRRVIQVDVGSTAGTTSDTVSIPQLSAITAIYGARWTTSTGAYNTTQATNPPQFHVGSSANNVQINRSSLTTADAFSFNVEGR